MITREPKIGILPKPTNILYFTIARLTQAENLSEKKKNEMHLHKHSL